MPAVERRGGWRQAAPVPAVWLLNRLRYVRVLRTGESPMSDLYERDFHAWANKQAALLRAGHVSHADILNIAEEIESMGRSERNQLTNRLAGLMAHLLAWQFQPNLRGNSWRLTIREQRRRAGRVLGQNPSLTDKLSTI